MTFADDILAREPDSRLGRSVYCYWKIFHAMMADVKAIGWEKVEADYGYAPGEGLTKVRALLDDIVAAHNDKADTAGDQFATIKTEYAKVAPLDEGAIE